MLGPRLESAVAARNGQVLLAKVDVDELGDLAEEYGVKAVPTVMTFANGSKTDEFSGNVDDGALAAFIDRAIA